MSAVKDLVIVTGMSGAGRTEAMHTFEDLGYFCVDNLPASLLPALVADEELPERVAVVCDARNAGFFGGLDGALDALEASGQNLRLVFLDAADEKLVARYKSSRRRHPLCTEGMTISGGIQAERSLLYKLRLRATDVIDTTDMLPQQLKARLKEDFGEEDKRAGLDVTVYSFGFKHAAPLDADIVIDVRFLPNPYYNPELKCLTGLDPAVRDFVMYRPETEEFLARWKSLLDCVMPGYVDEGKTQLAIAVGCTGGQHRSVALAEATGDYLKSKGYRTSVAHRDLRLADLDASSVARGYALRDADRSESADIAAAADASAQADAHAAADKREGGRA